MATHKGKMFPELDYQAMTAYGIGAMCWRIDGEGDRWLQFVAPNPARKSGWMIAAIRTMRSAHDWGIKGDVNGWDGNLEKPTFNPSIWLCDREGWHGFIRNGDLIDA